MTAIVVLSAGLRLGKIEKTLEQKRKQETRRYNKAYPGELVHFDTKRLPYLCSGQVFPDSDLSFSSATIGVIPLFA